jgi:hypothetical protein
VVTDAGEKVGGAPPLASPFLLMFQDGKNPRFLDPVMRMLTSVRTVNRSQSFIEKQES